MKNPPNIIISCGKRKRWTPAPALELYCGGYFLAMKRWALSITTRDRIYILSAKYGLIHGSKLIAPYESKMGARSQVITSDQINAQARALNLKYAPCIFVGGNAYSRIMRAALSDVQCLFDYIPGGIGKKTGWLQSKQSMLPKPIYEHLRAH